MGTFNDCSQLILKFSDQAVEKNIIYEIKWIKNYTFGRKNRLANILTFDNLMKRA